MEAVHDFAFGGRPQFPNLAVGLGNAADAGARGDAAIVAGLLARAEHPSELVREHVAWALARHAA